MPVRVPNKVVRAKPSRKPRKALDAWSFRASANGVRLLQTAPLKELDWLIHAFSTRPGGVSERAAGKSGARDPQRPTTDLNLGFTDSDSREHVLENRGRFLRALGASQMRMIALHQIHSDIVHVVSRDELIAGAKSPQKEAHKADAVITREPGVLLTVQTADCIPILLADVKNKAIAAIHSGWRGSAQRIAEKTLGRMRMEYGTRPQDVLAAIGPGIGRCCYEVGSDVAGEFAAKFPHARDWFDGHFDALAGGENDPNWLPWLTMRPPGHAPPPLRVQLDLPAANRAILQDAGIPAGQISSTEFCTACRLDLFFSYRREGPTGRMMAAIGIRK